MTGVLQWRATGSLGRTGWEDEEGQWPFYVRQQLECTEPCLGRADEPTESLWVRIEEKMGKGGILVGVCYRPPDQEEQADEALYRQIRWEQPRVRRPWCGSTLPPPPKPENKTSPGREKRKKAPKH